MTTVVAVKQKYQLSVNPTERDALGMIFFGGFQP